MVDIVHKTIDEAGDGSVTGLVFHDKYGWKFTAYHAGLNIGEGREINNGDVGLWEYNGVVYFSDETAFDAAVGHVYELNGRKGSVAIYRFNYEEWEDREWDEVVKDFDKIGLEPNDEDDIHTIVDGVLVESSLGNLTIAEYNNKELFNALFVEWVKQHGNNIKVLTIPDGKNRHRLREEARAERLKKREEKKRQ